MSRGGRLDESAPAGRPTDYTKDIADLICDSIADGKSLRSICLADDMPNKATVFRWLSAHDEFRDQYARAREAQADTIFDEILDIANTPIEGTKTKVDKDGNVIEVNKADMIDHRRLQIDARKWMAGKLRPKKYGDKLDIDQTTTHEAGASVMALMKAIDGRTRTK